MHMLYFSSLVYLQRLMWLVPRKGCFKYSSISEVIWENELSLHVGGDSWELRSIFTISGPSGGFVIMDSIMEKIFNSYFFNFVSLNAILADFSCLPESSRKHSTSKPQPREGNFSFMIGWAFSSCLAECFYFKAKIRVLVTTVIMTVKIYALCYLSN